MIRQAILTLGVLVVSAAGFAQNKQPCATDEFHRQQIALHPGIQAQEARLNAEIDRYVRGYATNPHAKTTAGDDDLPWPADTRQLHIPIVVHILSDLTPNVRYISDNEIYGMVDRLNSYYNKSNNLSGIINPFIPYIGNAHITFHLATRDPLGKPTRGIVRQLSQHAAGGDELAKVGGWAPDQYLNIYLENIIGRGANAGIVLAYATFPTDYADNPYSQGVISRGDQALAAPPTGDVTTLAHEIGHYLFLYHTWNSSGQDVEAACGDDEVDDTPPTKGHFSKCSSVQLADTSCALGYFRNYDGQTAYHMFQDSSAFNKHKDYPDTTNTQNIMDYSACTYQMFTNGQVARMRTALRSDVGSRSHLIDTNNLVRTGVWNATTHDFATAPDVAPTAEFTVSRPFVCADPGNPDANVTFTNRSYNDTADVAWEFSNNATVQNSTNANSFNNSFGTPGWVTVKLTATGNNGSGANTVTKNNVVYAADPVPTEPKDYYQEFNHSTAADSMELTKYPIFNYFGTDHKWEFVNNAGYYDKTSIRYANYDARTEENNSNITMSPRGDYADFYTPGFNLAGFSGGLCNLSFYSSGASRTNRPSEMNDRMEIAISTNCGLSWQNIDTLLGGEIANNGYFADPFTPAWPENWKERSTTIPSTVRNSLVYFRFRFKAGIANPGLAIYGASPLNYTLGTGNNFYLDRLHITNAPLGVKNGVIATLGMSVAPNPTSGAATVKINGGDNSIATVTVSDVTGKLVYSTSVTRTEASTKVLIPAAALAVKGMYLVKVVTNGATETQKLIVY